MKRYNYETLIAYCIDNELEIKPIENSKCTRETIIEGNCKTPNCKESFSKTFRQSTFRKSGAKYNTFFVLNNLIIIYWFDK